MIKSTNLSFGNAPTIYRTMATDQMDLQVPQGEDRGIQQEKNRQLKVRGLSFSACFKRRHKFGISSATVPWAATVRFSWSIGHDTYSNTSISKWAFCYLPSRGSLSGIHELVLSGASRMSTFGCSYCRSLLLERTSSLVRRRWTTPRTTRWDSSTTRRR